MVFLLQSNQGESHKVAFVFQTLLPIYITGRCLRKERQIHLVYPFLTLSCHTDFKLLFINIITYSKMPEKTMSTMLTIFQEFLSHFQIHYFKTQAT